MTMEPMNVWLITVGGRPARVRLTKEMADASAAIDRNVYGETAVKVIPVLLTEIEDVK